MPHAPALLAHPRGGRITTRRLALRAAAGEPAEAVWIPAARELDLDAFALQLGVEAAGDSVSISLAIRNRGTQPSRLSEVGLGFEWAAPESGPQRVLCLDSSATGSTRVVDLAAGKAWSDTALLVGGSGGAACALIAARETGAGLWRASATPQAGVVQIELVLSLDARLEPGESLRLDSVDVATGDEASDLLEAYAERWGRDAAARSWRPAPLVCSLPGDSGSNEQAVRRALDTLASQCEGLPVEVLMLSRALDVGAGPARELESLAAAIRQAGLVPGLRTAPFVQGSGVLDLARDDSLQKLEEAFRTLHRWGFFCFDLEGFDGVQPLRLGLEALRRGASEEAFLMTRGGSFGASVGLADARIASGDAPDREARLQGWMHRRLWLGAADTAAAAEVGAVLIASGDPADRTSDELADWGRAARVARRVDERGVPGAVRVVDLLGEATRVDLLGLVPTSQTAPPLVVFCDFDGTFSVQDVGATLAVRYGGERRPQQWARYERGEITPWDYNLEILDGLPVDAPALEAFLHEIDLDPGARALLDWCQSHDVPFRILSDGFDWNLNRLQLRHGVRFPYTANHLRIEHGQWRIRPGAPDPTCGCGTGTCKAGILRAHRAAHPGTHRVHIGNGRVSDSCGAIEAETAFAKDSLADSLERQGVAFRPFETLHDVIPELEKILAGDAAGGGAGDA